MATKDDSVATASTLSSASSPSAPKHLTHQSMGDVFKNGQLHEYIGEEAEQNGVPSSNDHTKQTRSVPRKRKSDVGIYIQTSKKSTGNGNHASTATTTKNTSSSSSTQRTARGFSNGSIHHRKDRQKTTKNAKTNFDSKREQDDKYTPFDFSSSRTINIQAPAQQRTQPPMINKACRAATSADAYTSRLRSRAHSTKAAAAASRPIAKTVKFHGTKLFDTSAAAAALPSPSGGHGIKFRKSHNNLPIMHPDEILAIQQSKKNNKTLYKQRASMTAAQFGRRKQQQQKDKTSSLLKDRTGRGMHANAHLTMNMNGKRASSSKKKQEYNDCIFKLQRVINGVNWTDLQQDQHDPQVQSQSQPQMHVHAENTLREIVRTLQLLRHDLSATPQALFADTSNESMDMDMDTDDEVYAGKLRHNKHKHKDNSKNQRSQTPHFASQKPPRMANDDNMVTANASLSLPPSMPAMMQSKSYNDVKVVPSLTLIDTHLKEKEDEQKHEDAELQLMEQQQQQQQQRNSLVSALLFASKMHTNQHFHPSVNKNVVVHSGDEQSPDSKITLTRRRFSLHGAIPTEIDRAGIEVARWLSTGYSTFGRYEIPPSPIGTPLLGTKSSSFQETVFRFEHRSSSSGGGDRNGSLSLLAMARKKSSEEEEKQLQQNTEQNLAKSDIARFSRFCASDKVMQKLRGIGDDWDWCIFDLYEECGDSILLLTAHYIFDQLALYDKFSIKKRKFEAFFSVIQRGYQDNPYHSSLHGADVLVNLFFWIKSSVEFRSYLSDLDIMIALISAACHDFKHPGLTQNFQINTNSDMALLYNGRSVLENMHCSETIRLLIQPSYQIFRLKKSEFRYVRELMTDMILGTDMQIHSDHVKRCQSLISSYAEQEPSALDKEQNTKHMLVIGLHVADIANPCKPWLDCKRWTYMLMEEWFRQGDKERTLGLDISPMMDRTKPNIPRGQIGFIDYIVRPLFEHWKTLFSETETCLAHLFTNKENWTQMQSDADANDVRLQLENAAAHSRNKKLASDAQRIKVARDQQHQPLEINSSRKVARISVQVQQQQPLEINNPSPVPFTPEQAEALHVEYPNIEMRQDDDDDEEIADVSVKK